MDQVDSLPDRPVLAAMRRGASLTCPSCGKSPLFQSYLVVAPACVTCGEELHHQRADDAPAYFTMFIVGHVVIGLVLALEQAYAPPSWLHAVLFLPMLLIMSLWLLPRIKGSLIALQWAKRMHGFGGETDNPLLAPPSIDQTTPPGPGSVSR